MRPLLKVASLATVTLLTASVGFLPVVPRGAIAQTTQDRKADGDRLFEQGTNQQAQNQNEAAIASFQQALAIYREVKDRQGEGKTLKSIGVIYWTLKDYPKAIAYAQQVLNIAREIKDADLESRALNNLGLAYQYAGNLTKSLDYLQQSLAVAQKHQNQFMVLAALQNLAQVYQDLKQPEKAIAYAQQGLVIARKTANLAKAANFLAVIGDIYNSQEQYPQALEFYQQALPLVRQARDKRLEASILRMMGLAYSNQKQYEQAIAIHRQALAIVRGLPDKAQEAFLLGAIGDAYKDQNQYKQAIDVYQQALTAARTAKDKPLEADVLAAMASVYFFQEDFDQEIEFVQKALAIRRELHDERGQLTVLINLGNAYNLRAADYRRRGMNAQAQADSFQQIKLAQETISLAKKLQAPKQEAQALILVGQAYFALKDHTQAELFLRQGAELAGKNRVFHDELSALSNLKAIYSMQGNKRKAIEIQLQYIEIARQLKDKAREALGLITLGSDYAVIGDHQKALESYQQALAISRQTDFAASPPILRDDALAVEFYALWGLSNAYGNLGEYDQELDFAQQANRKAQSLQRKDLEAQGWLKLAQTYNHFNNFSKAAEASQQALSLAQQVKDKLPSLESDALQALSDAYIKQGNYAMAEKTAAQSLTIARQLEDPQLEKNALETFSEIYNKQGNYPKALAYTQQALAVVQKAKLQNYEFLLWINLVQNYIAIGDTTKAMETAQQAIAFAKQHQNPAHEALALELLGLVYKARGDYEQGIQTTQTAQRMFHEQQLFIGEVGTANELSQMHEAVGDYQKMIAVAEPALMQAQKIHDRDQETELTLNLGNAYRLIGNYAKAKALLEQGLKSAKELKIPRLESIALNHLGNYYAALNDFQKSLALTQQSLKIAQDLKSPPLLLSPQFNLGEIYNNLGDYAKSREFYQQALATAQQLKNRRGEGVGLLAQANTYFAQGKPQETIALAQQALTIFREVKLPGLAAFANRMLSIGYGELGNEAQAMTSAQAFLHFAQNVGNPVFEKNALSLLGSLHRKFHRNEQAIAAYQQALAVPTDEQVAGASFGIYAGLGQIYADRQQAGAAIAFYKQSINGIEQVRRGIEGLPPELQASFLQATFDFGGTKTADIYRHLADLLISQGRLSEAEAVLALLKNQEIKDYTQPRRGQEKPPEIALNELEKNLIGKYTSLTAFSYKVRDCETQAKANCQQMRQELRQQILALNAAIAPIEEAVQDRCQVAKELVCVLQSSDRFRTGAQAIIQQQPGTLVISPLVLEDKVWILVAAGDNLLTRFETKVDRRTLGTTVLKLRQLLEDPNADVKSLQALSHQLYQWLIEPIETQMIATAPPGHKITHLVFALDRVTRYVPMAVLFDGHHYLTEKYTISTVLSADAPENVSGSLPKSVDATSVLAVGVSQSIDGFPPLQNVPQELAAIIRQPGIFPGEKVLDRQFTRDTLEKDLPGHQILHIATHGQFVPQKNASFLLLGDGKFPIADIRALNPYLQGVNLVVLSACQTALGSPEDEGIEIPGVSSYFLTNGAKSVIASLWSVDDASTSLLMQQFYQNLATGKLSKAEALRQAQLELLQGKLTAKNAPKREAGVAVIGKPGTRSLPPRSDFSHPYYWAPFILIGNSL